MGAMLIGRTGVVAGRDYPVSDTVRIGAARDADIRILAEGVSRNHARLWQEGDTFWIEDTGSTNGTFVSGIRVSKERVHHLDVVTLGRAVDLIFLVREGTSATPAPPGGIVGVKLTAMDGPEAGQTFLVPKGEITLGRAESNNVVVASRAVSKVHARIERGSGVVTLRDLDSVNGTLVNDTRIVDTVVLGPRDRICLGGVRTFSVELKRDGATAPSDTPATAGDGADSGQMFSQEWKTKLVWSEDELAEMQELMAGAAPGSTPESPAQSVALPPVKKAAPPQPAAPPPVKKAAPPQPAAPPPVKKAAPPQPAAPPPVKKATPPQPAAPPPVKKAAPAPVAPSHQKVAQPPQTEAPTVVQRPPAATEETVAPSIQMTCVVRMIGTTTHDLSPGTTTLGRAVSADILIHDKKASRRHAEIKVTGDTVTIEDQSSVNGTKVNGKEITGRHQLKTGDQIAIGETEWTVEIR